MLKGSWKPFLLLWGWTLVYFLWQSINFTRSMRYQMLVYPTLAIIAAWAIVSIWDLGKQKEAQEKKSSRCVAERLSIFTGVVVLASTMLWAYSFSRIYTRPITRLAASEWIYQNVPGPIDIHIENNGSTYKQPLSYPLGTNLTFEKPVRMVIKNNASGKWFGVDLSHIVDPGNNPVEKTLLVTATDLTANPPQVASGTIRNSFGGNDDPRGGGYQVVFGQPIDSHLVIPTRSNSGFWSQALPLPWQVRLPFGFPGRMEIPPRRCPNPPDYCNPGKPIPLRSIPWNPET